MIALVDFGAGNLASVCKAFSALGAAVDVVRDAAEAEQAEAIVVPGVGHFGATRALGSQWYGMLRRHVEAGRPLLGICLGMQWLFAASEEAPECRGLGVLPSGCRRLSNTRSDGIRVKVPHVGWNSLEILRSSEMLEGVPDGAFVYFTHSYAAPVGEECVAASSHGERFAAAVERDAVWGTQFHPEKSGEVGLQILRNFVRRTGRG